jgi:hypothetical protein
VAEPFLDLGDICLMRKRVGGRGGTQRMHTEAVHFGADAGRAAVFQDDVVADRTGIERPVELARAVVSSPGGTRGRPHRRRGPRAPRYFSISRCPSHGSKKELLSRYGRQPIAKDGENRPRRQDLVSPAGIGHANMGNAGAIISFRPGVADAEILAREFYPQFSVEDVVNYHIQLKLMIDGAVSKPFSAETLGPLMRVGRAPG